MATEVRFRRGTTAQHSTFVGAPAEITVDTDRHTVVVHDGVTAGGFALAGDSTALKFTDNISTLKSTPLSYNRVYVKSHTSEGDGGHGVFRAVTGAAAGTYVDNNGTVIVPTGGDGSSAWLREYSGAVNVHWFGAKGDGVTDDTAAIQAAIQAAVGNTTFFSADKVYIISSELTLPSSSHLFGYGAKLFLKALSNSRMLSNNNHTAGNTNIFIEGLEFDGNKNNQGSVSTPAILFKKSTFVTLQNVIVHDSRIATYLVDSYNQILFVDCSNCTVEKCESYNSDQGGVLGFYGAGGNHKILNNNFYNGATGIEGSNQTDSVVSKNTVRNVGYSCISYSGLRNVISENILSGSSQGSGIVCGHAGTPPLIADYSVVSGNIISDTRQYGIATAGSSYVTITNNQITRSLNSYSHSIYILQNCKNIKVIGNTIIDGFTIGATASGIFVEDSDGSVISDNIIKNVLGNSTGHGIYLYLSCPNTIISGNIVNNSAGSGILLSSSASTRCIVNRNNISTSALTGITSYGEYSVIADNVISDTNGLYGILLSGRYSSATGNTIFDSTTHAIYVNAIDYCAITENIVETASTGINLATGSDYHTVVGNVIGAGVTTPINRGTTTGGKIAHNIGSTVHET